MAMAKLLLSPAGTGSAMHAPNLRRRWTDEIKHEDDVKRRAQTRGGLLARGRTEGRVGGLKLPVTESGRIAGGTKNRGRQKRRAGIRSLRTRAGEDASVKYIRNKLGDKFAHLAKPLMGFQATANAGNLCPETGYERRYCHLQGHIAMSTINGCTIS